MTRKSNLSGWKLSLIIVLLFTLFVIPATAQNPTDAQEAGSEEVGTAQQAAPTREEPQWTAELPPLTAEQRAQLKYWTEHTHLPGPARTTEGLEVPGPEPGTESHMERRRSGQPLAPGDATLFRKVAFGGTIPSGYKSNVMESSVGVAGRYAFFTGNWFAARSTDGGKTWSYVNPYSGFSNFCCDQVSIYDEARNIHLWLRMGSPNTNGVNVFKLGVSKNGGRTFCTYTTKPTDVNSKWTKQWWDYPHIQLGADYLYMAWNVFDRNDNWKRSVMLRWPLDSLRTCSAFSYNYYANPNWFTFVPVQGAYHTMYFASNWPPSSPWNRIRIWKWHEDSTTISWVTRSVTAWNFGSMQCGSSNGNWMGRSDDRLLTGARYSINNDRSNTEPRIPGRKILAWWWNAAQGGDFPYPYIDAAAFYENNLRQVSGWRGRPLVWNSTQCFGYPSATPNKRQDVGLIFHFGNGSKQKPSIGYAIADDYVSAPPGWTFHTVRAGKARPSDNAWGDYNTVREFEPTQKVWVGGSHCIPTYGNCQGCSVPVFFVFGRERDRYSWIRWRNK